MSDSTTQKYRILILDQDSEAAPIYHMALEPLCQIDMLHSATQLFDLCTDSQDLQEKPRLLICDPEYSKGSFVEEVNRLRITTSDELMIPEFFIVSARDDLKSIRFFLAAGALDYLLKPINANELAAKVEFAVNQLTFKKSQTIHSSVEGIVLPELTLKEHQLLSLFLIKPNYSITRDELHSAVWNKVNVQRKTLDVHIYNLRRKLRPSGIEIICKRHTFTLQVSKS